MVECELAGEIEIWEDLPQYHFIRHKSGMTWPRIESCELRHGPRKWKKLIFFSSFLGCNETESTWYAGHKLAYCTSPGW
jgi:hypothetical protein